MTARSGAVGALPYYGGKSPSSSNKTGPWIAGILGPPRHGELYCEPFAGMCGVLLSRERANSEIVFDLDDRIVTWWRVLQQHPDELGWIIDTTPHSESEFRWATRVAASPADYRDIDVAKAVTVLLSQGLVSSLHKPLFSRWKGSVGGDSFRHFSGDRLSAVYERIKEVVFDTRPAAETLAWASQRENAVIYCDPPYESANTTPYAFTSGDKESMADLLLAQRGRVAISGYGDEWDMLGWARHERGVRAHANALHGSASDRIEVLWTNFEKEAGLVQQSLDISV